MLNVVNGKKEPILFGSLLRHVEVCRRGVAEPAGREIVLNSVQIVSLMIRVAFILAVRGEVVHAHPGFAAIRLHPLSRSFIPSRAMRITIIISTEA